MKQQIKQQVTCPACTTKVLSPKPVRFKRFNNYDKQYVRLTGFVCTNCGHLTQNKNYYESNTIKQTSTNKVGRYNRFT